VRRRVQYTPTVHAWRLHCISDGTFPFFSLFLSIFIFTFTFIYFFLFALQIVGMFLFFEDARSGKILSTKFMHTSEEKLFTQEAGGISMPKQEQTNENHSPSSSAIMFVTSNNNHKRYFLINTRSSLSPYVVCINSIFFFFFFFI
jgi:hypothetical protein